MKIPISMIAVGALLPSGAGVGYRVVSAQRGRMSAIAPVIADSSADVIVNGGIV